MPQAHILDKRYSSLSSARQTQCTVKQLSSPLTENIDSINTTLLRGGRKTRTAWSSMTSGVANYCAVQQAERTTVRLRFKEVANVTIPVEVSE